MSDAANTQDVVIERRFDAPVDLVWAMWTDPSHFKAWYGPTGATIPTADIDLRVGGRRLVSMAMETPDGPMQMWFAGEFVEIDEHRRLVYTEATSDADGNPTSPETRVIVEFAADGDATELTLTHVGVPADSPGAMGWNMALDALADHLADEA